MTAPAAIPPDRRGTAAIVCETSAAVARPKPAPATISPGSKAKPPGCACSLLWSSAPVPISSRPAPTSQRGLAARSQRPIRIGAAPGVRQLEISPVLRRVKQAGTWMDGPRPAAAPRPPAQPVPAAARA